MMRQKGFTLIELLLVLSIMIGLSAMELSKIRSQSDEGLAKSAGEEMAAVQSALKIYMDKRAGQFQRMGTPTGETACVVAGNPNQCQIDLMVLVRAGLLPTSFEPRIKSTRTDLLAFARRYVAPATPFVTDDDWSLEAIVITQDPWLVGGDAGAVKVAMLNQAARVMGPAGGVSSAGIATGLYGSWLIPAGVFPAIADGQLLGYLNVQASVKGQFVRLDGSSTMTGPLNMSDYRINNMADAQLLGPSTLRRNQMVSSMMPNWVLKGAYNVVDYDADNINGTLPKPYCPDSDGISKGLPRVLIRWAGMYNDMYGGYSDGTPSTDPLVAQNTLVRATSGWEFMASEPVGNPNVWQVSIKRYYDSGYVAGEGMAEVYCYYP